MKHLLRRLHGIHIETLAIVLAFWAVQTVAWVLVMAAVAIHSKPFTSSLLFTVEISLFSLEQSAIVGFLAAWSIVQSKHNATTLANINKEISQ